MPDTPLHSVRVPDPIWYAALAVARSRGETLTSVIIKALQDYARSK